MSLSSLFNCILIDTNAWDAKENDFAGLFSPIIPSLQKAIKKNSLVLLSHPVLLGETKNHILGNEDRSFRKKSENAINAIKKHGSILRQISLDPETIAQNILSFDLANKEYAAFNDFFSDAVQLPFGNSEEVFSEYFSAKPPFAESGDKKREFPDAFAINSLIHYLDEKPGLTALIVTGDNGWKQALDSHPRVVICDNIDEAINLMHGQVSQVVDLLSMNYSDIESLILSKERELWFTIRNYFEAEDVEISKIQVQLIRKPIILDISDEEISVQVSAALLVDGYASVFDIGRSWWDGEEKTFLLMSYSTMSFEEATGHVSCSLEFVPDEDDGWKIKDLEFIIPNGVELELNEDKLQFRDKFDPADYQGEVDEALQDYYLH